MGISDNDVITSDGKYYFEYIAKDIDDFIILVHNKKEGGGRLVSINYISGELKIEKCLSNENNFTANEVIYILSFLTEIHPEIENANVLLS